MASINYASKEISCKIVYYGPGLSGKTTNLQYVHQKIPSQSRGQLISLATDQDRTLYFDFLPVDIGKIHGFATKFQLYTVPGQVYYNATRKLVLRGVDGLVFVADSQKCKMDENIESLENLVENLSEYGYEIDRIPLVLQYNKRDLNYISSVEELQRTLNPRGLPCFEAVATRGNGIFDTLKCISKLVLDQAKRKQLFPEPEAEPRQTQTEPVEVDLSRAGGDAHEATAVVISGRTGDSTSEEAAVGRTVQQKATTVSAESRVEAHDIQEDVQPLEGRIGKHAPEAAARGDGREGSTIIGWSAGRSGRRFKSKSKARGFFLLRWISKLFKQRERR